MPTTDTIGLILAGGRSQRMHGQDKALQLLHGEPLLVHAIRRLRPQVDGLLLNSNASAESFATYGLSVVPDCLPGFLGPLAGIHAGLFRTPHSFLMTVAVDLPFMPLDLVARLRAGLGQKPCAYVSHDGQHVLALLWRPGMAADVEEYLGRGGRSLKKFLADHGHAVRFDKPQDRGLLCNLNTPEDLARAEKTGELQ